MHCNLRPPEPCQPFPALITTSCHVWRRWTYPLPYYNVFAADSIKNRINTWKCRHSCEQHWITISQINGLSCFWVFYLECFHVYLFVCPVCFIVSFWDSDLATFWYLGGVIGWHFSAFFHPVQQPIFYLAVAAQRALPECPYGQSATALVYTIKRTRRNVT